MSHTVREKQELLNRVRRIRGQVEGIERSLVAEDEPELILQTIAACRGAMNGLMAKILEGHVRDHVLDPHAEPTPEQKDAAELLVQVIRSYLK